MSIERRRFLALGALSALSTILRPALTGAQPKIESPVRTGGSATVRIEGGYEVWTKHVGPHDGTQVLTLHGGPGLPHYYFECFEDFLPQAGIGYWYYDQLGCGFSDQPTDASLWRISRFTDEVERVRAALMGTNSVVLLGHSWGGMLAIEYALKYPQNVRALVISNMTAGMAAYTSYLADLRRAMPADVQKEFDRFDSLNDHSSTQYQEFVERELYQRHICRLVPWPEPVRRSVKWLAAPVYNEVQGSDEFHVTGNMKSWERWDDLHRILVPTLVIGARYDTMRPDDLRKMAGLLPKGRVAICDEGSHLAMYDDQRRYFSFLLQFLRTL